MKMPKKLKTKWLKALRSGEYGQTKRTLTDGKGNFCCLGVLQHAVDGGKVECWADSGSFRVLPSVEWLEEKGIIITERAKKCQEVTEDKDIDKLVRMNDGTDNDFLEVKPFTTIANWIEKNVEGY